MTKMKEFVEGKIYTRANRQLKKEGSLIYRREINPDSTFTDWHVFVNAQHPDVDKAIMEFEEVKQ